MADDLSWWQGSCDPKPAEPAAPIVVWRTEGKRRFLKTIMPWEKLPEDEPFTYPGLT